MKLTVRIEAGDKHAVLVVDAQNEGEGSHSTWACASSMGNAPLRGEAVFWRGSSLHLYSSASAPIGILDGVTHATRPGDTGRGISVLEFSLFPRGQLAWVCLKKA